MAVTGITDAMIQYGRATEVVFMNKPKNSRPYGIKRPDSMNIIAVLTGVFLVLVIISALM
jgi:hypothetical protein